MQGAVIEWIDWLIAGSLQELENSLKTPSF